MPKINLKQLTASGKSVVGQVAGALEDVAGAAGKGAFSVSAGRNGISISTNFNELLRKKMVGNRIISPIKELYQNGKIIAPLVFPADLDNEHYIIFKVMRQRRKHRNAPKEDATFQNIVLPIPTNLTLQSGANYSDKELGQFGAMAAGRMNSADINSALGSVGDAIGAKISAATNAFKSGDTDAAVQAAGAAAPAVATAVASKLAGPLGGMLALGGTADGVVSGLSVSEGMSINPHMAVVFEGVGFRSHQFTYKFMARNQGESDTIRNIINTFQYYMHPEYTAGSMAFKYPQEFQIEFASAVAPYLYDIGTCVLKDFSVNYNGEGTPLFFEHSGAPVSIEINMTFQETFIVTKETLEHRMEG
jgi:hypothetical protein